MKKKKKESGILTWEEAVAAAKAQGVTPPDFDDYLISSCAAMFPGEDIGFERVRGKWVRTTIPLFPRDKRAEARELAKFKKEFPKEEINL